jgi:hypothetical protein
LIRFSIALSALAVEELTLLMLFSASFLMDALYSSGVSFGGARWRAARFRGGDAPLVRSLGADDAFPFGMLLKQLSVGW